MKLNSYLYEFERLKKETLLFEGYARPSSVYFCSKLDQPANSAMLLSIGFADNMKGHSFHGGMWGGGVCTC